MSGDEASERVRALREVASSEIDFGNFTDAAMLNTEADRVEEEAGTPATEEQEHAASVRENDRLILDRLMGMLHELPRRELEAVLAGASFMEEADRLREALAKIADKGECSIGHAAVSKHGDTFCAYHVARGALNG